MIDNGFVYHEVDFLFPAQKFNIQYSYVSKKGLSFVREYVLRLVHLAPVSRSQISKYFGMSRGETNEAIGDLIERGELTLSQQGKLVLTRKAAGYFSEIGESPKLSNIQDSSVTLSFDLATFTCVEQSRTREQWKAGLFPDIDNTNISQSEKVAEKEFQLQFEEILDKGYLRRIDLNDPTERPTVYTVDSVAGLAKFPFRLKTQFKMDMNGGALERDDYEQIGDSRIIHELTTPELSRNLKSENVLSIAKAMVRIGDTKTMDIIDSDSDLISPQRLDALKSVEDSGAKSESTTFIGPIYSPDNWGRLQDRLAPILASSNSTKTHEIGNFTWIAPSDAFWGKSDRFIASVDQFLSRANTKNKHLYKPALYLPVTDAQDSRGAKRWLNELQGYQKHTYGLAEGFLDGNVEIMLLKGNLAVVIYHYVQPSKFPVPIPVGFITTEKKELESIGAYVYGYLKGMSSHEKPNDCGPISSIG